MTDDWRDRRVNFNRASAVKRKRSSGAPPRPSQALANWHRGAKICAIGRKPLDERRAGQKRRLSRSPSPSAGDRLGRGFNGYAQRRLKITRFQDLRRSSFHYLVFHRPIRTHSSRSFYLSPNRRLPPAVASCVNRAQTELDRQFSHHAQEDSNRSW